MTAKKQYIRAALAMLGVDRLALAIHDQSFPSICEEETGRGSPYSEGGKRFARFIGDLGFNAFQLGPQGKTSRSNPSPYDSTLFAKSELSISVYSLAHDPYWAGLLGADDVRQVAQSAPSQSDARSRASYLHAFENQYKLLRKAYENFKARIGEMNHLWLAFTVWKKQNEHWLERDSLFEALANEYGNEDWRSWSSADQNLMIANSAEATTYLKERSAQLREKYADAIEFFEFCQWLAHQQHQRFRDCIREFGLLLYADLQVGFSQRDMWALRYLLLPNYSLGAPPSRTNPDGQPWGYPVLNPDLYFEGEFGKSEFGQATKFVISRIDKLLLDFDGVRIDHPHGIICPWVYNSSKPDALRAVQQGARLFESPDVPEHSQLAKFANVDKSQLNPEVPRYADNWVTELSDEQIEKYGFLVGIIKERMLARGFEPRDIICEVLSSCPYPLKKVLERHGLGRFRVTQKAQTHNKEDVYRSDNAKPDDWIMVGTHDTPSLWRVAAQWTEEQRTAWAGYLANRLAPHDTNARADLQTQLASSLPRLVEAMFADLFVGPAKNVSIFFADLLGMTQIYNEPGVVAEANWVLSVPNDYEQLYEERLGRGEALSLPAALSLALRARFPNSAEAQELINKLSEASGVPA